ncbi:glycogen phosphorylase family [Cystoisospora suis]|uniref:Alpha-1,4 glucan phosphorylase n=1 Tax=Cystoisospora suis TaxID=483139 RepID=A0A2C6L320_9APIC|nr:glycogen phosphorylase family [Cystoisospora suis]
MATSADDNVFANDSSYHWEMRRKASFSKLTGAVPRAIPGMYNDEQDPHADSKKEKLWKLMETYISSDIHSIQRSVVNHVEYTCAKTRFNCDPESCYRAAAFSVRDRLIETLNDTNAYFHETDCKRAYYLSLEFLLGRGRLAACFLDSMATVNLPCWGYGIRYTYGIFEQKIVNGRQVEYPDYWLTMSNPWEIERPDCTYAVRFYGAVKEYRDPKSGKMRSKWVEGEIVQAMAYDNPIPGFDTYNTINLRLWKACPSKEFDFHLFNVGRYLESVRERQRAESISAVLYPNDNTVEGKELRLKQQYFFVCATIQDVMRRFKKVPNRDWKELPSKIQLQLNDTHPTIAIPEMMRILLDIEGLDWDYAWGLTKQIFNYTNHTVLPEALEKWSADLIARLLPRHLLIINEINFRFLNEVRGVFGDDWNKVGKMSIYEEGEDKRIRMANLAVIGSAHVNGVAAIHSELVKKDLFPEFVEFYSRQGINKFTNVTNGVTPRRWIYCSNRGLADLFSNWLGSDSWLKELDMVAGLQNHIDDPQLRKEWRAVKRENKLRLAAWVEQRCGVKLDVDKMLFDIQVKRIHEYKRQLLNCLYALHRYLTIKKMSPQDRQNLVPRATMIGGKAAPGYYTAKNIIKLVNNIGQVVNNDPDVSPYLKVIFLPNYNVSNAQVIIPASDLSQHISTAGTEASGTSNMKFVMNGGLILGTLDGANIEIREECGDDTMFIFGAKEHEVARIREQARNGNYPIDGRLREVFDFIRSGKLACGDAQAHSDFVAIVEQLCNNGYGQNGDFYLLLHDFSDYCRAQQVVDETYKNVEKWTTLSIKAASSMGKFSTDRCMREYAKDIWMIDSYERPPPDEFQRMRSFANDNTNKATAIEDKTRDVARVFAA